LTRSLAHEVLRLERLRGCVVHTALLLSMRKMRPFLYK